MVTFQNKENIILRPHLLRQTNVKKYLYCTSKKKKKSHKKMFGRCSCHTILCWHFHLTCRLVSFEHSCKLQMFLKYRLEENRFPFKIEPVLNVYFRSKKDWDLQSYRQFSSCANNEGKREHSELLPVLYLSSWFWNLQTKIIPLFLETSCSTRGGKWREQQTSSFEICSYWHGWIVLTHHLADSM